MAAKKSRKSSSAKPRASRIVSRKPAPAKKAVRKQVSKQKVTKPNAKKKSAAKAGGAGRASSSKRSVSRNAQIDSDRVGEIQRLIDVMVDAGAVEVELEEAGRKLRVRLKDDSAQVVSYAAAPPMHAGTPLAQSTATSSVASGGEDDPLTIEADMAGLTVFNSPMVGTFYAAPSPDAEAFVAIGDAIEENSTLCVLEAMKVMNEIKAEVRGTVVEILVQDGQPVEFGQPLFNLKVD